MKKENKRGSGHFLSVSSCRPSSPYSIVFFAVHDLHLDLPWICLGFALSLALWSIGGVGWLSIDIAAYLMNTRGHEHVRYETRERPRVRRGDMKRGEERTSSSNQASKPCNIYIDIRTALADR